MSPHLKVKTFILALNTFGTNIKKAKSFLKDKRLTQSEKTILNCFLLLRDNQLDKVIKTLEHLVTIDPIVESQKKLILGIAYNNQNHHMQALPLILESLDLMEGYEIKEQQFIALNNLFIIYRNLKDINHMRQTLKKMHAREIPNELARISLLRADFKMASVTGKYKEAETYLNQLDKVQSQMSEAQAISHLVDKFDFYVKTDRHYDCESILINMKVYRKFHMSSNYNFMKLLLQHYLYDKTLYVTDKEFKDFPMLYYQIKIIQKLEESNFVEAKKWWLSLASLYPSSYGVELGDYRGDKCLFSICLDKYERTSLTIDIKRSELPRSKEKALVKLLEEVAAPIPQEMIYELIWEKQFDSKLDLNKLAQLVYSVKAKTGIDIKMKRSCYFIDKNKTKAS